MKVLVIWPPHVPSYFNAGHHTPLFMTAGHLRTLEGVEQVDVWDTGVVATNWKEVGDRLFQGRYDVIAMMNDFDAVDGFERFVTYARELSPDSRLVTFGRLSSMNTGFFTQFDIDAIVQSGDYECGVAAVVTALRDGELDRPLPGVAVRCAGQWQTQSAPGAALDAQDWILPDHADIPHAVHDQLYAKDENKFCGIPFRRELVVPVSRGCPIGCDFCDVPRIFGKAERRLSVDRTVEYIESSFAQEPFEYVSFYAPTFTLDRRWVRELCARFQAGPLSPRWKCSTTIHHLDEDLVRTMGAAGCFRISVGLETLEPDAHGGLPRVKHTEQERFHQLAQWCREAGIELNVFVIAGLPGTSPAGIQRTVRIARAAGARIRPTMYTPFHRMRPTMTTAEMGRYNRQLLPEDAAPADPAERAELYDVLFGHEEHPTTVYEKIPRHASTTAGAAV